MVRGKGIPLLHHIPRGCEEGDMHNVYIVFYSVSVHRMQDVFCNYGEYIHGVILGGEYVEGM